MNDVLNDVKSLSWWFSVVVIGIIINIISPTISKVVENQSSKIFESLKRRIHAQREKRKKLIESLKGDEQKLMVFAMSESRFRLRNIYLSISGISLGVLGTVLNGIQGLEFFSNFLFFFMTVNLLLALKADRQTREVRNILNEIYPDLTDKDISDWF